jgi:hypothetical protein
MIERGGGAGFLFEAAEPGGIAAEGSRQHFDRHIAPEPRVASPIDLAHAAGANQRDDLVRPQARSVGEHKAAMRLT